jgi:2-polyprenyl-3-methyl-5-hydroxy-6-metoxy-1,4-benzoquinol methylase
MTSALDKLLALVDQAGHAYVALRTRREYHAQVFAPTERGIELAFLFRHLVAVWPRTVLDVGTGRTALPQVIRSCGPVVTAIDNVRDYWSAGMVNRHYHVIDDDIRRSRLAGPYDLVTCLSVLEHIPEHLEAVRSMVRLLRPGGHLVLSFPYTERSYVPNVYALADSSVREKFPFATQSFSRVEVDRWLADTGAELVDQEYWRFFEGAHWTCGRTVEPPVRVGREDLHQLGCLLLRKPGPMPAEGAGP